MVKVYWITGKKDGHIVPFRFKEIAEKKLEDLKKHGVGDQFYIDEVDTPKEKLSKCGWKNNWYWAHDTPEKEYFYAFEAERCA